MPTHIGEGGFPLFNLFIQMLFFSRNNLTDTPKNHVILCLRTPLAQSRWHIKLTITVRTSLRQWLQGPRWGSGCGHWQGTPGISSLYSDCGVCPTKTLTLGVSPNGRRDFKGHSGRKRQMSFILSIGLLCLVQVYSQGTGLEMGYLDQRFICISKFNTISKLLS